MALSNYAVCDTKNLRFIKKQETSGLLSSLGIMISKIPLVANILFWRYKMNEIVN